MSASRLQAFLLLSVKSLQTAFVVSFLFGQLSGVGPVLVDGNKEKKDTVAKAIGGVSAPPGRFPYMCTIKRRSNKVHVCGGTLIKEEWVLTAAHCVDPRLNAAVGLSPLIFCDVFGLEDTSEDKEFSAKRTFVHGSWDGMETNGHDIALIQLDRAADFKTPDLPSPGHSPSFGASLASMGWGLDESGKPSQELQIVERLNYYTLKICNKKNFWSGRIKESMICAGNTEQDTERGDSGGPLLELSRESGQYALGSPSSDLVVGVVSFGHEDKEPFRPGIYTSVSYHIDWIYCIMESKSPKEDCDVLDFGSRPPISQETSPQLGSSPAPAPAPESLPEPEDDPGLCLQVFLDDDFDEDDALERIQTAIEKDKDSEVGRILCDGLDPNVTFGSAKSSLLTTAARYNAVKSAKVILQYGTNIEYKDDNEDSALTEAAEYGSVSVARLLIKKKADIESLSENDHTPLSSAVVNGQIEIVKLLVREDANIESKTDSGRTPLHLAAQYDQYSVAEILLAAGAESESRSTGDSTPLDIAAYFGSISVAELLLQEGADVDATDNAGFTPLHSAASRGHISVVKGLLDGDASKSAIDDNGDTPYDVICKDKYLVQECDNDTIENLQKLLK